MKRTIFLAAMALMISAGINAQNNNQIQSQDQDRTRAKTHVQIQNQAKDQNQTQTMTQTQARKQLHQQLRTRDNTANHNRLQARSHISLQDCNQIRQAQCAVQNSGARHSSMMRNAMRASGGPAARGR